MYVCLCVYLCVCEQYNSKAIHQNASKPKCIVLNKKTDCQP